MRTVGLILVTILWSGIAAGVFGDVLAWLHGLRTRRYHRATLALLVASGEAVRRVK